MAEIKMTDVVSGQIKAIGYDEESKTLRVEFKSGGTYDYFNVPVEEYNGFVNSPSKGSFHRSSIKGHYEYEKLEAV